jgi:hypothetical protein
MNFKGNHNTNPCSYLIMLESLNSEAILKLCFSFAYLILVHTILKVFKALYIRMLKLNS